MAGYLKVLLLTQYESEALPPTGAPDIRQRRAEAAGKPYRSWGLSGIWGGFQLCKGLRWPCCYDVGCRRHLASRLQKTGAGLVARTHGLLNLNPSEVTVDKGLPTRLHRGR